MPTLVLDEGEVLIESTVILDALDDLVGPDRALLPRGGAERRAALKVCALAMGLADKAVSLVYERLLHAEPSEAWVDRCRMQIAAVLAALEGDRKPPLFWFGEAVGHADVAVACALRFLRDAHPALWEASRWPAPDAHAARCEALPAFRAITQAFVPPV